MFVLPLYHPSAQNERYILHEYSKNIGLMSESLGNRLLISHNRSAQRASQCDILPTPP